MSKAGLWVESVVRDLRLAVRGLVHNPGVGAAAVLTLAAGIGVSVAMFAFVDAALLEPLPYANASRLMSVNQGNAQFPRWGVSYSDFLDWQRLNKSFSSLDIYNGTSYLLGTPSGAQSVHAERVSGGFFRTLGINPVLGRDFNPGEDRLGGPNVLLLSYQAWMNRFSGTRTVVGRTVDLDGAVFTIIGVLPRTFAFAPAGNAEFWVPINVLSPHEQSRDFYPFWGIGRLRDGVSRQSALAEMNAISHALEREYGLTRRNLNAAVVPLAAVIVGDVRSILLILLGGAALLLLIACVNVGSLFLARSETTRREVAVRTALGASPTRLMQALVADGLLVATCGTLAGLMTAVGVMRGLSGLVPENMVATMPFLERVGLNLHTCVVAVSVGLIAAHITTAPRLLRLSREKLRAELAEGGRGSGSLFWQRTGSNLVIVELILAVVLLSGAGLLGKSLYRLLHVPLGFDSSHLATADVNVPGTAYQTDSEVAQLRGETARRLSALPGVRSVGMTSLLPGQCNCATDAIQVVGRPNQSAFNEADERHVDAGYMRTLGVVLVRGRFLAATDDASRPRVAVINEAFARKYFPNEDPVGQRIADDEGGQPTVWEIVGEVADVHEGPLDVQTWPAEYFPLSQTHDVGFSLAIRTAQDPAALLPSVVRAMHQINANIAVTNEETMADRIDATQTALLHRFAASLVEAFAAAALVLGILGLYSVIAYSVAQRTREIGVRIALGAQRREVYALVLRQAAELTGAGLVAGLICSVAAARLIRSLLFGVGAWDGLILGGVATVLAVAAIVAAFVPARRAVSVDPVQALRAE